MARKIYMTSLKGGTGVTSCAVGIAVALADLGERTLVADGDRYCGGALLAGECAGMQTYTLADYSKGACRAKQTLVPHRSSVNLSFMSSVGLKDDAYAEKAFDELDGLFDYIISDKLAPKKCDSAIIVTEPYNASVRSADCCKSVLSDGGMKDIELIVNKLNGGQIIDGSVMTAQEISKALRLPLAAIVPEDLTMPTGGIKKSTKRAFALAAGKIAGRREGVCNVIRPYFGPAGFIKRKLRAKI